MMNYFAFNLVLHSLVILSAVNICVNSDLQQASAQQGAFEEQEKRYLRKVLVEERTRYCLLASCFRPVVVSLIRMVYSLLLVKISSRFVALKVK